MKANKTLALLRRTFYITPASMNEQVYKYLVWSSVEYAYSAWGPYNKDEIDQLEMIQCRDAQFAN